MMTAWEALEDAGVSLESVAGSRAGVFVGLMLGNYWDLQRRNGLADLDLYSFTGSNQRSFVAGRLSFAFDLRGPSVAVDTACSSSLVAVHMALAKYDHERRPAVKQVQLSNRKMGPERVINMVHERAPNGFGNIHDIIAEDELAAVSTEYARTAGFDVETVNTRPCYGIRRA
jgi:hypothetical protein